MEIYNAMDNLIKQFLCCTPINKMDFTVLSGLAASPLNLDVQENILHNTVNSDLVKQYPLKMSYQRAFLKLLMQKIKESGNEIHDDLYVAYCRLVSLPNEESFHYRHFLVENGTLNCITLKENTSFVSEGTTGLCSWQAAVVLSGWCAEHVEQFRQKSILELGCGVGLTGISVVSGCSPKRYLFSDCHKTVLDTLYENVKLNLLPNKQCTEQSLRHNTSRLRLQIKYEQTDVQIIELRWEDIGNYVKEVPSRPDVIIGADILYENDSFGSLIMGLRHLLTLDSYVILAATVRNANTISQFLEQLGDHSLTYEECIPPTQKRIISIQSIDTPVRILKIYRTLQ